jgi:Protein of unknown function (DUF3631)
MSPAEHLVDRLSAKRNGAGWIAKCPAHDDRQPSLSINEGADGRVLLKCFAGCTTENIVAAIGLTMRDLFPTRSRSQSGKPAPAKKKPTKKNNGAAGAFDFYGECVTALKLKDLVRLGNERWWSHAFCQWLHDEKKIGLYKGHFAFPVERDGKIVAAKYKWGPGPNDWGVYPTEQGAPCFVLGDPKRAKNIHLGESQWDICSLADRTDWFRDADNHAFVATPGAGNAKLIKGLIPPGASVLAWPQNDPPGEKWLRDVAQYADVPIAKAIVPAPHKDLGEWCKAGASPAIYNAWWRNEVVEVPKLPDLGTLLDEICKFLRQYISFTSEAQPAVIALWIVHTWFVDCFEFTPYLHVFSPTRSCGKSHLLECIAKLVRNVLSTVSLTVAALFRTIEQDQPTLLIDEVDTIFSKGNENEELRAILNAGFERGSKVRRCVGPNHDLKDFAVFCPKALAGIGRLPDTVGDRCIPIHLIAKKKSDKVQRFRKREVNVQGQAAALEAYSQKPEIAEALRNGRAELPEISDRQNDIAEGLIVIADLAGGDWPGKVRKSLIELFSAKEEDNTGVQLLASCRDAFGEGQDRITTKDLLDKLIEEETGTPWAHWWENDLNKTPPNIRGPAANIARLLRPFGIKAVVIKLPDNTTARGYLRKDFEDNWNRYCPLPPKKT